MPKGRIWPTEWRYFEDAKTGVNIQQLTNYRGHSLHFYFTNPGWYDNDRKLLFSSDRENKTNLFGLDLKSGEITQLTDLKPLANPWELQFLLSFVNPTRDEVYFWYGRKVIALDLKTLKEKTLWEMPEGFTPSMLSCTSDGKYICCSIVEDLSDKIRMDLSRNYVGFEEVWKAKPLGRIMQIASDGSEAKVVWEEKYWIGHVNTSPTQPHILTFCHEGPWHYVDNRIWGFDLNTGKAWKVRPRERELERIGHEYWHQDGIHIGYHGKTKWPDGDGLFGYIKYDNTEKVEVKFPFEPGHIHSNDFSLVVGDGFRASDSAMRLWKWNGQDFDGPRILCEHNCSFHIQQVHVHPCFTPDGKHVLYTSDFSGYGNIYLAEVPEFESLPELK